MNPSHLSFPHSWSAEILPRRPLILPHRQYVYPRQVEEIERGALELLVRPATGAPFLATCALGFADPAVPTGLWSAPNPNHVCAVAGGYAYLIDTTQPEVWSQIEYRPVFEVLPVPALNLLLFTSHQSILAWGAEGRAWQSPKLSWEGVKILEIDEGILTGLGWDLLTDKEFQFTLDLRSGERLI